MTANARSRQSSGLGRLLGRLLAGVGLVALLVVLMLYLFRTFERKVPDAPASGRAARPAAGAEVVPVRQVGVPHIEPAVGTIRPVYEVSLNSKLMIPVKVNRIDVLAGQAVEEGEILVELDDTKLQTRLQSAQAALAEAQAGQTRAAADLERLEAALRGGVATRSELDAARAGVQAADARVEQARQAVGDANADLGYAVIRAPVAGVVIDKNVSAGDTIMPGQQLLRLYDPTRMQLVATVRESLAQRLRVGDTIDVRIESIGRTCTGTVSEIVPEAQAASRSFSVKVTGPCEPGVYAGIFGRLLIPLDEREVVVVPAAAVRRVGQLDMVDVVEDGRLVRRAVQVGERLGEDVQVLSGLRPGEQVALPERG